MLEKRITSHWLLVALAGNKTRDFAEAVVTRELLFDCICFYLFWGCSSFSLILVSKEGKGVENCHQFSLRKDKQIVRVQLIS